MSIVTSLLRSAEFDMRSLDAARAKIDTDLRELRARDASDAFEAIDQALRSIIRAIEQLEKRIDGGRA